MSPSPPARPIRGTRNSSGAFVPLSASTAMAARKLQSEIERVLKRVSEGVEAFDNTYSKMQASTNVTQKEKLEADLKTQIKKLQRLRDQIKTWVASNDIKDKTQLVENRRLIETQMERFKACEKEMKTKAFSKEGLIQASKLDPKAREKLETTQWLQSKVEELLLQVEHAEAEIETLQGGAKKKKSGASNSRAEELEHMNERRKWHVSRLEIVLRLLDNGSLPVERVLDLKDDVSYFVENNGDDNFDEDEGIYDELNLDEEEEKFGLVADDGNTEDDSEDDSEGVPPRTPSKKADDDSSKDHKKEEHSPILRKAGTTLNLRKNPPSEVSKPPPPLSSSSQPLSSVVKNGIAARSPAALPVRYATAAAAAVSGSSSSATTVTAATSSSANGPQQQSSSQPSILTNGNRSNAPAMTSSSSISQDQSSSSPSLTQASVSAASPLLSSTSASGLGADGSSNSQAQSPLIEEAVPTSQVHQTESSQKNGSTAEVVVSPSENISSEARATTPLPNAPSEQLSHIASDPQSSAMLPRPLQQASKTVTQQSILQTSKATLASNQPGLVGLAPPQQSSAASPNTRQQQLEGQTQSRSTSSAAAAFPEALSDLVTSFDNVKQKATLRMAETDVDHVHKLLNEGYQTMPQPLDTEKPKYYVPRNSHPTPAHYPQTPHPLLSSPTLFQNLDLETLFYVFYYLPGTYQQYLAAKELKRQSWRFHVKYLTWFQRHSEPQAITDEYEQGVYVYFDWEGSWCQRKKADFRFEYRYLSED